VSSSVLDEVLREVKAIREKLDKVEELAS